MEIAINFFFPQHWCGSNPYPKAKSSMFCCKWQFLQIQGVQHATPSHCWPQETISRCLCGDAKFFEQCMGFIIVFNLLQCYMGRYVQWQQFLWGHQVVYNQGQGVFIASMGNGAS